MFLPLISPSCSVSVLTRARAVPGVPEGLSVHFVLLSLTYLCYSVLAHPLLAGSHVLFSGFDQTHLKLV